MAPPGSAHPNFTFGGLLVAGGAYGFYKGSTASLIAGAGSGSLLISSGMLVERDPQLAFLLGSGVGGLLTAGMLPRFLKTKKVMPAGMVTLVGALSLSWNLFNLSKWWDPESLPFRTTA
mmetsp:Transcript_16463/g.35510  ORF Transcript_16463/g.35510 Transcript_16463/m.35510 type:complete len:119 (-) Transcript_16463:383-739(-)|eukprot:CAMPEP_0206451712 /NCGR_PEP_ID=MMETSP0324_2-20121206/19514_1 /ASSEMBLY_ACC=CAM_ASM_000836 /TAXON_ID=2866 /ORGANISM="Crypthecodinium cohnii, Strain Seligo" /LENGTH=118 /DNA_ID=CAMNT_0053921665 /DNA_START=90 /DNA_END=446 /DNA_ORIENTATION=+